jgi:hypothetical protein
MTLGFQASTGVDDVLSSVLSMSRKHLNIDTNPNIYRVVPALNKVMGVFDGAQPKCWVCY